MLRTYSELSRLKTFQERYDYLRLAAIVADETFGFDRYLNQVLYHSNRWKQTRHSVIIRDNGCDLACPERDNISPIVVHHMNPITLQDVLDANPDIFNPEYLICVSDATHKAIHYGDSAKLETGFVERHAGDTCLWR